MSNWLGPFKTADDAIDALRRSVAEIIGADPNTWPDHKNAPLAISAAVGLREGSIKQLTKERDALRAELDALKSREGEVVYRWLALDYSGFCYGSNPPDNLPNRCNLKAFYAPAEVAPVSQINFEDETLDASDGVTKLLLAAEYWKEKASALLAKITEMEQQEPLYALPGAQNVPKEAIAKILTEVMNIAVANGADSRSMPDEYVEVAAWLCGIPAQNATSIPEG